MRELYYEKQAQRNVIHHIRIRIYDGSEGIR
ncbi:hypothetical protein protein [Bacillus cereus G9241]|nr:hypothetical protein protein [Bacillus cereus G9241]